MHARHGADLACCFDARPQPCSITLHTEAVITPVTAKLTLIITESDFTVTEAVMIKYIYLIHYSSYCNALQQL